MPKVELTQLTQTTLINAVSAANTAAATSTGVDITGVEMALLVQQTGAVTGSLDGKIQGSVDNSVWNDLIPSSAGLVGPQVTAANKLQTLLFETAIMVTSAGACRFLRYVGTIVTGPVLISVVLYTFKKYAP